MNKYRFQLHNLDCANCANAIENKLSHKKEFQKVTVSFATQMIAVETELDYNQAKLKLEYEIKKIEPDVTLDEKKKLDMTLLRIIMATVLFGIGLCFPSQVWLFFVSYIIIGYDILWNSVKNILKGELFDEFFLMSLATIGAFIIGEYPEGVAVMLFFQIGEYIQDKAVNRSRNSITKLLDMKSNYANLITGNITTKVEPSALKIGDYIICKPGEKIPVDGVIVDGHSTVDSSMLTGESIPRELNVGDTALSGMINLSGLIKMEVTKLEEDSMASVILNMIENATEKKTHTERFITRFAKIYTPIVVLLALLICILPPLLFHGVWDTWIYRSLVFLVISCPCALVISIPLGFFSGIGIASKHGILVKGSDALEMLSKIDTAIFDKTGTITEGVFDVTMVTSTDTLSIEEVTAYAAYAEYYSNHPIAKSIVSYYGKKVKKDEISNFEEISGKGLSVTISGDAILVGNEAYMMELGVTVPQISPIGTTIYVAKNKICVGYLVIGDKIKDNIKKTISELKTLGINQFIMVSGDNEKIVAAVSKEVGMDAFYAEVLPDEKAVIVKEQMKNHKVLFVGDGMNDALVLTTADLGISMGGIGSDAAIEASDMVIMNDDIYKLVTARSIAIQTKRIIYFNIIFALAVKVLVLLLGVFGFTTIWLAVFADVGVTLLTILNTLRITKRK